MLARVANSLYWTGRYTERSEHLARYLRVQYFSILDAPMSQNKDFILKSILTMYGIDFDEQEQVDEQTVLVEVGLDPDNGASVLSTVIAARENARSLRYIISTELWEAINQYYHYVKDYDPEFYRTRGLYDFTLNIAKHCAIIRSYVDHTMIHDDIWVFINLGIYLERAAQIIRILNSKLQDIAILSEDGANIPLKQYQWTTTLKVMEGFDMHRRVYKRPQSQETTFEFLVTNRDFPRSVAYNLNQVNALLTKLSFATNPNSKLHFKAGKLASFFHYLEYDEVKNNLPQFFQHSLEKIYSLHDQIEKEYLHG